MTLNAFEIYQAQGIAHPNDLRKLRKIEAGVSHTVISRTSDVRGELLQLNEWLNEPPMPKIAKQTDANNQ